MATVGDPKAQRVVLVAAGGQRIAGGAAMPVKQLPAGSPVSGAPVIKICLVNDGRPLQGGPALPVVVVASGGEGGPILPAFAAS